EHVGGRALPHATGEGSVVAAGRHHHHRRRLRGLAQIAQHAPAVEAGHHQVEDHEIGPPRLDLGDGLVAVGGPVDLEADVPQDALHEDLDVLLVVDHQDALRARRLAHGAASRSFTFISTRTCGLSPSTGVMEILSTTSMPSVTSPKIVY